MCIPQIYFKEYISSGADLGGADDWEIFTLFYFLCQCFHHGHNCGEASARNVRKVFMLLMKHLTVHIVRELKPHYLQSHYRC